MKKAIFMGMFLAAFISCKDNNKTEVTQEKGKQESIAAVSHDGEQRNL
jgi:hypothetical protein